ncbi:MAG: hypothetical protein Q4C47_05670, partial [Planctomycetia bacterium]|nr:hypothetical protein [Planctomycetia bacterium]
DAVGELDFEIPARPLLEEDPEEKTKIAVWPPPEWGNGSSGSTEKNGDSGEREMNTTTPPVETVLSTEQERLLGFVRGSVPISTPEEVPAISAPVIGVPEILSPEKDHSGASSTLTESAVSEVTDESTGTASTLEDSTRDPGTLAGERLAGKVTGVDFRTTPLWVALQTFGDMAGIPVSIDFDAVDYPGIDWNVSGDISFSLPPSRRPAGVKLVRTTYLEILGTLTREHGLVWSVSGPIPALRITTPDAVNATPTERRYSLNSFPGINVASSGTVDDSADVLAEMVRRVAMAGTREKTTGEILPASGVIDGNTEDGEGGNTVNGNVSDAPPSARDPDHEGSGNGDSGGGKSDGGNTPDFRIADGNTTGRDHQETVRVTLTKDEGEITVGVTGDFATHYRVQIFLAKLASARDTTHDSAAMRTLRTTGRILATPATLMMYEEQPLDDVVRKLGTVAEELQRAIGPASGDRDPEITDPGVAVSGTPVNGITIPIDGHPAGDSSIRGIVPSVDGIPFPDLKPEERIPVIADRIALAEAGVTAQTPLDIQSDGETFGELLSLPGGTLPIDFRIAGAGAIELTSREMTERRPEVVLYPSSEVAETGVATEELPEKLRAELPRLADSPYADAVFADPVSGSLVVVGPREFQRLIRHSLSDMIRKGSETP